MSKRILALVLCVVMLVPCLASCRNKAKYEGDVGAYITMYLTDDIYDFDPANAYYNADTINVLSMLYDTLFKLDEKGKVKNSLAKEYEFFEDERTGEFCMEITLEENASWTNGTKISAADVEFAWRRLLSPDNDSPAASLLYDIKNARAAKMGDVSVNHVGVEAVSQSILKITFESVIDEDRFLLNLTSVATAPLLESYVSRNDDWAKKATTIVTSGPYKLGKVLYLEPEDAVKVSDDYALDKSGAYLTETQTEKKIDHFYLERNVYYRRDVSRDAVTKTVKNYRILVDCSKTDAQILDAYKNGEIFYIGSIPLSIRNDELVKAEAQVSNSLSTFVLHMNQYAAVSNGTGVDYIFANPAVRQALSLVIDRETIAKEIVFAEAAVGLVAPGVFDAVKYNKKADFRDNGTDLLATSPKKQEALDLLAGAGINPGSYSFSIKVADYDDVHAAIVEKVKDAWVDLGFNVTVETVYTIQNNDYSKELVSPGASKADETPTDVCDDLLIEALQRGNYEVLACDYTAYSADAFSVLSSFAMSFSGSSVSFSNDLIDVNTTQLTTHFSGSVNVEYDVMMEAIYYLPYYASLNYLANDSSLQRAYTARPYQDTAKALAQNALITADEVMADELVKSLSWSCKTCSSVMIANARPEKCASCGSTSMDYTYASVPTRASYFSSAIKQLMAASLDISRAFEVAGQTNTAKEELDQLNTELNGYLADLSAKAMLENTEQVNRIAARLMDLAEVAANAAKMADNRSLYQLIGEVYAANGITASATVKDWTAQKTLLLHKAEELLMKDLPVIPVVFNQNAVLISEKIEDATPAFYAPYDFQSATLDGYEEYIYTLQRVQVDQNGNKKILASETRSIFDNFPIVKWEDQGKVVEKEQFISK